jgi:hypothetical protein
MRRGDKMRREVILVDLGAACEDSREGVGRAGFFPSVPTQVNFELAYAPVGGRWRLFALSVSFGQAAPAAPQAAAPAAPAAAAKTSPPAAQQ